MEPMITVMCLIGIKLLSTPNGETRLIVAANRDERHDRATAPANWWPEHPGLFAGKDLVAGGTWLGATASGRFAAVTNVRSPSTIGAQASPLSRGDLPLKFLTENPRAKDYCKKIIDQGQNFGGFNFLAWDTQELWWCSNQGQPAHQLNPGIYAVSNGALNTPWPKSQAIATTLETVHGEAHLLAALRNVEIPPGQLPDTGIGVELERHLAPAFILNNEYGTRCSTVLTLGSEDSQFTEVSYGLDGGEIQRVSVSLNARESERRR